MRRSENTAVMLKNSTESKVFLVIFERTAVKLIDGIAKMATRRSDESTSRKKRDSSSWMGTKRKMSERVRNTIFTRKIQEV